MGDTSTMNTTNPFDWVFDIVAPHHTIAIKSLPRRPIRTPGTVLKHAIFNQVILAVNERVASTSPELHPAVHDAYVWWTSSPFASYRHEWEDLSNRDIIALAMTYYGTNIINHILDAYITVKDRAPQGTVHNTLFIIAAREEIHRFERKLLTDVVANIDRM